MENTEIEVTVTKTRGRPEKEIKFDSATRQRLTRSKAHSAFLVEGNIEKQRKIASEMSTSNLIALLPTLMAKKWEDAVKNVFSELVKRAAHP